MRTWDDHGVALGHLRLSIINPSPAGRNPMSNEDGTVWIVHNGEIYNHRALRRELERAGHRFASDSDTEVIVHGYEEWGDRHVARLRGMFSYALYDRRGGRPRILLVRDRFGVKPLHYSWDGDRLAFGSEPKALLELTWVEGRPTEKPSLITSSTVCARAGNGVRLDPEGPPGEMLVLENGAVRTDRYWQLSVGSPGASTGATGPSW